jgi:CRISPR-associated exonuclease Cas4
MTYGDEDLIQLSALQHYIFCPRQCALIHIEQAWTENLFTAEGRVMHERVHVEGRESRGDVRIERGVPLRSMRLGLSGKSDVVEFHRQPDGTWQPFPVEYKRGRPKKADWDKVQLCAQAMCLEEMLGLDVPRGALFYGKTRRRLDVVFNSDLRGQTEETARRLHELIDSGVTPPPVYTKGCESCSFLESCLPTATGGRKSVSRYLKEVMETE